MFGKPVDHAQNLLPQLRSKDGFGEMTMDIREKLIEILRMPIFPHELVDPIEADADYLLDSGVTVKEWISVKDRLPEDGEIVLVCGIRGGVYTAVFNKPGQYRGWHKLNSKSHYCDPTYWMPLPDAPKGDLK